MNIYKNIQHKLLFFPILSRHDGINSAAEREMALALLLLFTSFLHNLSGLGRIFYKIIKLLIKYFVVPAYTIQILLPVIGFAALNIAILKIQNFKYYFMFESISTIL